MELLEKLFIFHLKRNHYLFEQVNDCCLIKIFYEIFVFLTYFVRSKNT